MNNELEIKITSSLEQANAKLDKLINQLNKGAKYTDNFTKSASNLGKAFNLTATFVSFRKIFNLFNRGIDAINDYTENLNLFHVVMGDITAEADKFQNIMNEKFGNNTSEQLYIQSMYHSLTESMGLHEKYAYIISEGLTQMAYDLSSLFNKEQKYVASALRSGLVGQTKPVRNFGLDITENSLQPLLDSLGIDRTVRELSQVEKEIIRYIALLRQSSVAHGDMANTIESPSNQLRVFKNQLVEAQRWFSALFINTFAKAMPIINGVTMAIKEVMRAFGVMLGIEIEDYNTGIATYDDWFEDIETGADDATDSVKELKRQTLGFDQINNINENKDKGNGDYATSGGIDQRLLDAIESYDNGMDKVRMKATEIRDRIMEWLGFTKEINPLTGEVSFKLKKGLTNLKLIGGTIGTLIGIGLVSRIAKLITKGKSLLSVLKTGGLLTGFKNLISPVGKVSTGIVGLTASLIGTHSTMKNLTEGTDELTTNFGLLSASILGAVGSGALIGSVFGGWGAIIGGAIGLIGSLTTSLMGYYDGIEQLAKNNIFGDITLSATELEEITSNIGTSFKEEIEIIEHYKSAITTLEETWNSSIGVVEKYGAMYGVVKTKISEEDIPTIISSIETLGNDTKNIIGESTQYSLDLWTSMMNNSTNVTKEEQANILKTIMENGTYMTTEIDAIQGNITETYKNAIETRGYLTDAEYDYISEQLTKLRELTNISMSTAKTDLDMLQKDINDGRISLSEEGYNQLIEKIKEKEQLATDEAWSIRRKAYENAEEQKKIMELAGKSAEEIQKAYQSQIKIADENYEKSIANNQKQVLNLMETLEKTIEEKRKEYVQNAGEWGQTLYGKITGTYTKIYTAEEEATIKHYDKMLEEIENYKTTFSDKYEELATDTIDGYVNSLDKGSKNLVNETARVFEMVPATTEEVLDSHSPSRRFFKLGQDTILGYINGINDKSISLRIIIEELINDIKNKFNNLKLSINISTNVESSFNSILTKTETFLNKFRTSINTFLSKMTTSMNGIRVGGDNKLYYTSVPYISVPKFANGGFPEDGLFYANHNELVGQFSNGKTAVANNEQITEGIKRAVIEGMTTVLANKSLNSVKLDIRQDEGIIVKTAIEGINNITRQTGENPIEVW